MAAAVVEPLDRAQQADRALLDQVGQRQTVIARLEALGHVHDEPEVGLGQLLLGGEVAALDAARQPQLLARVRSGVRAIRDRNDAKPSEVSDFMPSSFRAPPKGAPAWRLNAASTPAPALSGADAAWRRLVA